MALLSISFLALSRKPKGASFPDNEGRKMKNGISNQVTLQQCPSWCRLLLKQSHLKDDLPVNGMAEPCPGKKFQGFYNYY
ncbi:unnamed protein product [Caretta caretta]